jgi:hypothetical protein
MGFFGIFVIEKGLGQGRGIACLYRTQSML